MIKFILFIKRIYVFLLFLIFEVTALNIYANSDSFTRAKMLVVSNNMVGGIYSKISDIGSYFGLRDENRVLAEQLALANNQIEHYRQLTEDAGLLETDLTDNAAKYIYTSANIIRNSTSRPDNFITLDKGRIDGIEPNMAIITPQGNMIGYILNCSDKFSVGISILNSKFTTAGKIKHQNYFGKISWNGTDPNTVLFSEVSKYADINIGDTIVTDYSSIFPPDVLIGTVQSFELNQAGYYDAAIDLLTPVASVKKVLLVRYADIVERTTLEREAESIGN